MPLSFSFAALARSHMNQQAAARSRAQVRRGRGLAHITGLYVFLILLLPRRQFPCAALRPHFCVLFSGNASARHSIVATIAGIVMMLGRGTLRLVFRSTQRGLRGPARIAGTSKPHVHLHNDAHSKTAPH